jgi:ubiquinone/menaquinone biosynthesis C-methylase UbiE
MAAFDALAADYDAQFSCSRIGRLMRQAVWRRLDQRFPPHTRVLELNCGTGEDALYLGQRGVQVLATDASPQMLEITRQKVAQKGLQALVQVRQLALESLHELQEPLFDGALSNFGGLNCIADWAALGRKLAVVLRPGAYTMLCVMGPIVPWERGWFLCHGAVDKAFRRLRPGGVPWWGLTIRYPSIATLQRAFRPYFQHRRVSAVGALLPPPYTEPWIGQYPHWLERLDRWERRLEAWPLLPWLADHYLLELQRV